MVIQYFTVDKLLLDCLRAHRRDNLQLPRCQFSTEKKESDKRSVVTTNLKKIRMVLFRGDPVQRKLDGRQLRQWEIDRCFLWKKTGGHLHYVFTLRLSKLGTEYSSDVGYICQPSIFLKFCWWRTDEMEAKIERSNEAFDGHKRKLCGPAKHCLYETCQKIIVWRFAEGN